MKTQIFICSQDAVFARMLELEFSFQGCLVKTAESFPTGEHADVVLLDLDSAAPPMPECYHRMIGFTRGTALSEDRTRRQCSMILHRPFDVRLLRREVMEQLHPTEAEPPHGGAVTLALRGEEIFAWGEKLALSPTEQKLLAHLIVHRGEVVTREALSELIGETVANKADVYVCFLRKKLAKITPVSVIRTVRNQGYVLDLKVRVEENAH